MRDSVVSGQQHVRTPPPIGVAGETSARQRPDAPAEVLNTDRRRSLGRFFLILLHVGLLILLIQQYQLESRAFLRVIKIALAGFAVHYFLPGRWKLPWFAALSLVATIVALGVPAGGLLIGAGVCLIGLCHVPLPYTARLVLVATAGLVLAVLHTQWPALKAIGPILGSMFAFRLMIYLYDLKHQAAPFGPARSLAYFFMLPNACFPLFPVVDYKTFCASDRSADVWPVYRRGMQWMFRGAVQLLLYKLVYQFAIQDVIDVETAAQAARYMVATYLLYLKVSGQFHLIVGLLHLFGFNLPETHHLYFLASSFTDFWRRINIYWKDFIMKLFFYPSYFAIRRMGDLSSIALATLIAFFATWVLHSWQWFWIRGSFLVSWQDISFWSILAILVMVNALYEAVAGRHRKLANPRVELSVRLKNGLATAATFSVICTLWTIWSCQSLGELELLAEKFASATVADVCWIGAGLSLLVVAGMLWGRSARAAGAYRASEPAGWRWRFAASTSFALGLLLLPLLAKATDPGTGEERLIDGLIGDGLNGRDLQAQRRGYYEELDEIRSQIGRTTRVQRPSDWSSGVVHKDRPDYLQKEFIPSCTGVANGKPISINRLGMRDREYELEKAEGTYRIVLVGSSHEAGWGVTDDETFENLFEDRLNREARDGSATGFEVLNLSMGGLDIIQKRMQIDRLGYSLAPDAVIIAVCSFEEKFLVEHLSTSLRAHIDLPYDELIHQIGRAKVTANNSDPVIQRRLRPLAPSLIEGMLREVSEECRRRAIKLFVLYRPAVFDRKNTRPEAHARLVAMAQRLGIGVLDLSDAFEGVADRQTLVLAEWDDHTNALGHRLLSDKLYEAYVKRVAAPD